MLHILEEAPDCKVDLQLEHRWQLLQQPHLPADLFLLQFLTLTLHLRLFRLQFLVDMFDGRCAQLQSSGGAGSGGQQPHLIN